MEGYLRVGLTWLEGRVLKLVGCSASPNPLRTLTLYLLIASATFYYVEHSGEHERETRCYSSRPRHGSASAADNGECVS